jgi:hypothetical protein
MLLADQFIQKVQTKTWFELTEDDYAALRKEYRASGDGYMAVARLSIIKSFDISDW